MGTKRAVACLAVSLAVFAVAGIAASMAEAQPSPALAKWVDPLPIPSVLSPTGKLNDGVHGRWDVYDLTISRFEQQMHRDLEPTDVQGYNGYTPGPIIVAKRNYPTYVRFWNSLPSVPMFPVDRSLAIYPKPAPDVRTAVHLHGGRVPAAFDGGPMDWFRVGERKLYWYPNDQRATFLWFHDHAMGVTRTNVYSGMAGAYLLRDNWENGLNLPAGAFEIPLVIQDRLFDDEGQLVYPGTEAPPMSFEPEFFGDTIIVNGKVWPYVDVEPRKYRLRVLNGSNARFYNLSLGVGGPILNIIGNEGGLLPETEDEEVVLLAPGERADIIVDFSAYAGENLVLTNDAPAPYPNGDAPDGNTGKIIQFRVDATLDGPDTSVIPANPSTVGALNPAGAEVWRDLTLDEGVDKWGRLIQKINKTPFMASATEVCEEGEIEVWRFYNLTMDTHPMHLHLVNFQLLDRTPFDAAEFLATGQIVFTGPAVPADETDMGWKDTVRMNPAEVTRIIMKFPETADDRYTGNYVYHCHILEHEEHDMMRPLVVVPEED